MYRYHSEIRSNNNSSILIWLKATFMVANCRLMLLMQWGKIKTQTSIHFLYPLNLIQGHRGAGAYPSCHWAKGGYTLNRSSVHNRANVETNKTNNSCTLWKKKYSNSVSLIWKAFSSGLLGIRLLFCSYSYYLHLSVFVRWVSVYHCFGNQSKHFMLWSVSVLNLWVNLSLEHDNTLPSSLRWTTIKGLNL